jgi:predicted MPP superfamily phosphohydrolase
MRDQLPLGIAIAGMAFQMGVWFYGGFLLVTGAPGALAGSIRKLRRIARRQESGTQPERELVDESRRRAITRAALAVPAAFVATAAGGAIASRQEPVVRRLQLPVGRDLTQLHGLTIAQVSDVHVGSYMDAQRLDVIRDAINSLGADYHVVTGDLLDNHIDQMDEAQRFLRGLKPVQGKFMCIGNHEYIAARSADTPQVLRGLRETGVDLVIDESRKLNHGGAHLWLMGIDYPRQMAIERATDRDTDQSLDAALADVRDDGAPRILLSHHPKTFFRARERAIDLTLSGHTHGGQIVLGRVGDYALSPVLPFEHYHNGFYQWQGCKLYVNSGAGGWMPVRINCPPEITLVEFVPA